MGITFFRRKFLCLTVPKIFVGGPLYSRNVLVLKFFWIIGVSRFCRFFCLTLPKNFVEEPFCVSECFGYRNTLCLRGEYQDFVAKNCCLTVPKKFVDDSFCLSQSGIQKFYGKEGGEGVSQFSVKNFWSKCRKISYGNPLVCHYFRVSKNFMLKRVMSLFSVEIFFVSRYRKKMLQQIGVSENFGYRKNFLQRWDHDFLSTIFCLREPKNFVREPFCVSENFWYKKTVYG